MKGSSSSSGGDNDIFAEYSARWASGDRDAFLVLYECAHEEIHTIARRQLSRQGGTDALGPGDLVHETVLRFLGSEPIGWKDKAHFLHTASLAMTQILIDRHRVRRRQLDGQIRAEVYDGETSKKANFGASLSYLNKTERIIDLERAISKLCRVNRRWAEVAVMKLFFGLSAGEISKRLDISENTVNNLWPKCRKFLVQEMNRKSGSAYVSGNHQVRRQASMGFESD